MTVACCRCKRVREGGEWKRPPEAAEGSVSHTYCPVCFAEAKAELTSSAKGYRAHPIGPVPVFSNLAFGVE